MAADRRISSGSPWEPVIGYSRAVVAGNYVHVSGTTATVDGVVQAPGDAYEQTRIALGVIERALNEAGVTMADVVRTRIYLANGSDVDAAGKAHGEVFGAIRPAATMLAGLSFVDPSMIVEIEADAYSTTLTA